MRVRRPDPAIFLIWLAAAGLQPACAAEPTPEEKLQSVQRDLDESRKEGTALDQQAKSAAAALAQLQAQSVAAARSAQQNEAQLTQIEADLAALEQDAARQSDALAGAEAREQYLLGALERLAASPPAAMVFVPEAPVDAARSGMLIGAAVPEIEAELRQLEAALDKQRRTRASIAAKSVELANRQAALDADRDSIAALVPQKQALAGETKAKADAAQKRVAALAAQAADLQQLADRLARDREAQEAAAREQAAKEQAAREQAAREQAAKEQAAKEQAAHDPVAKEQAAGQQEAARAPVAPAVASAGRGVEAGRYAMPATGEVVRHFGEAEAAGTAKGLSIRTRPGAQIVAPADGTVMFAGPFKGYGQILIIDHGGGYHSLLAGIGRIAAAVGQHVVGGEPVGTMGVGTGTGTGDAAAENAAATGADGASILYLELRRQGQSVNPLPFLAAHDGKASG